MARDCVYLNCDRSTNEDLGQGFLFVDRDAFYVVNPGTMITVQWLEEKAKWAKRQINRLKRVNRTEERQDERDIMVELAMAAGLCADWMAYSGDKQRVCVGPFSPRLGLRGETVKIKSGSEIISNHQDSDLRQSVSKRMRKVRVEHSYRGYIDRTKSRLNSIDGIFHPKIEWVGSGGCLSWTDANNVLWD